MRQDRAENKMGTMPVGKLLVNMSTPMMISMMVMALYNIVDSVFVAMISENALTAVSIAFPLQLLMVAFSIGTSIGVNALVARHLGEKQFEKANLVAANGIRLSVIMAVLFAVFINIIASKFYLFQTSDAEIIKNGVIYTRIVGLLCIGTFCQQMFEKLLQATGNTLFSMTSQMTGAVTNIIMDPILIFGIGPFPRMGVAGAAMATIFGQSLGSMLALFFNIRFNRELEISLKKYRFSIDIVKNIYSIGIPSIIMQGVGSVMTFCFNKILVVFSPTAVAVFGVYFKLQSFAFMPVFGLNNGMMPIVSYNYGAKNPDRIKTTIKIGFIGAVSFMLFCFAVFQIFPDRLLSLFSASKNMIEIGVPALRIISLAFLMAGFSLISMAVFQALGHGVLSLLVSLIRQLGVLIPLAWLFSKTGNLNLVWYAFPMAETVAIVLSLTFLLRVFKKEINTLYE